MSDLEHPLHDLALALRDQDNHATSHPVYCVQVVDRIYGMDKDYARTEELVWLRFDEEVEASEYESAVLSAIQEAIDDGEMELASELSDFWDVSFDGWRLLAFMDKPRVVASFFTEASAREYIRRNKHNLKDPHVYVDSAHRNEEWQRIRAYLLSLVPAPTVQ